MLYPNMTVNERGHLSFAGADTVALAEKYGTPLYLLDKDRIIANCQTYLRAVSDAFGGRGRVLYAGKALSFKGLCRVIGAQGLGLDVVSPGEIHTALAADFPAAQMYYHGNCKTDADLAYALEKGVGCFVVDNPDELARLDACAAARGKKQKVLMRLTPGIDPHTFAAVNTGKVDSKFGVSIETGQAETFAAAAMKLPHLELAGFHCHIGSQIFEAQPFYDAADIMLAFIAGLKKKYGFVTQELSLGGGFGVRYLESDPQLDIPACIYGIAARVKDRCEKHGIAQPTVVFEPGRSIVADAGMTLYTAGAVKTITGYRSYVPVDGGMGDNPRYALYGARYTVINASRAAAPADFLCSVAGRCCESGDLIAENISLAKPERGEILAVCVTGAYNYSMASNYNRFCRPAAVFLSAGGDELAIRRESLDDLCANDL